MRSEFNVWVRGKWGIVKQGAAAVWVGWLGEGEREDSIMTVQCNDCDHW